MRFVRVLSLWWPSTAAAVERLLHDAAWVRVMQVPADVADALARYTVRRKDFHTVLVDLSHSGDALWSALDKKSCRYEINKADRIEHVLAVNKHLDPALALFNDFIARSAYRRPLSDAEWQCSLKHADVFTASHEGIVIAAHVVMRDPPHRARLLYSATVDRGIERYRGIVGPLNKALHWYEIGYYRDNAIRFYDFGGIVLDERSPLYGISSTKRSFGGAIVTEQILYLSAFMTIRALARAALCVRERLPRHVSPNAER